VSQRGLEYDCRIDSSRAVFETKCQKTRARGGAVNFLGSAGPRFEAGAQAATPTPSCGWLVFSQACAAASHVQDFPSLDAWLSFLQSPPGVSWAAGCISRYLLETDLEDPALRLVDELKDMTDIFTSLISIVVTA